MKITKIVTETDTYFTNECEWYQDGILFTGNYSDESRFIPNGEWTYEEVEIQQDSYTYQERLEMRENNHKANIAKIKALRDSYQGHPQPEVPDRFKDLSFTQIFMEDMKNLALKDLLEKYGKSIVAAFTQYKIDQELYKAAWEKHVENFYKEN